MDDSFFVYLEQLELMIFFSGYPLVYLLIRTIGDTGWAKKIFKKDIRSLLPYTYGLVGILYLGLQLQSLYPDYSFDHINAATQIPALKIWGLLSLSFFIPLFSKKPFYSLLHSLVFFFFLVKDLYFHAFKTTDTTVLKNDMNVYSYSLLINLAAFIFIILFFILLNRILNKKAI